MKPTQIAVRWYTGIALALLLFSTPGCVSPQQRAEAEARLAALETKARSGDLLTEREWAGLIQPQNGWNNRSIDWLFGLIGRPDDTLSGGRMGGTFAIYKDKCIDGYTGKPKDLCFHFNFEMVGADLYDARKVRNL